MLGLLDRAAQLTDLKSDTPCAEPLTSEAALKATALAATLLFAHGQTTERTVTAAERLGRALGVTVKVLPYIAANGATAFLLVMAMAFGLILPRMLFERVLPAPA